MNKELIKEWVLALRSGKYTQGKTELRFSDEYCCLGVLADICKESLKLDWVKSSDEGSYTIDGRSGLLPKKVEECLEINSEESIGCNRGDLQIKTSNPKLPEEIKKNEENKNFFFVELAVLNDVYGLSFHQIADVIEEEFLNDE